MKTSVVYEYGKDRFNRAPLPAEADPQAERDARRAARFVAAHDYTFHYPGDKPGTERRGHYGNMVAVGSIRYDFPTEQVRIVPQHYVEQLDALDQQMAALERERRDLVAEAFRHGRKIKKTDLVVVGQEVKP